LDLYQRQRAETGEESFGSVTTEANLWDWLRDVVLPLGQYSRIESGDTAPGFPDVDCQLGSGISFKMELKCAKQPDARIPFTKKTGMRRSQLKWIRENLKYGGAIWVVAQVGKEVFIFPGHVADHINGATTDHLRSMAYRTLNKRNPKSAAKILHEIFVEHPYDF
jgi:hypothetical protein